MPLKDGNPNFHGRGNVSWGSLMLLLEKKEGSALQIHVVTVGICRFWPRRFMWATVTYLFYFLISCIHFLISLSWLRYVHLLDSSFCEVNVFLTIQCVCRRTILSYTVRPSAMVYVFTHKGWGGRDVHAWTIPHSR